jgi:hypothetical protein
MKFLETTFEEYVNSVAENNLHEELENIYKLLPNEIKFMPNLIFYGPAGVGKYSQMLYAIKKYSPSNLKYDKKMTVVYEKKNYLFRISDVHYEVDMSLLGCNSKNLWHEIYIQLLDVLSVKPNKTGIIVCRDFHNINSELLDVFYSYVQENLNLHINVKFILLTEQLSFIPSNIINCCEIINISRPSINIYNKCIKKINLKKNTETSKTSNTETDVVTNSCNLSEISNIKDLIIGCNSLMCPHKIMCNKIYNEMINVNQLKFLKFRDYLYEIFIYNLDVAECVWYILNKMMSENKISNDEITNVLIKTFNFFKYFNNNYRPIYHLENYLFYLITIIHGY